MACLNEPNLPLVFWTIGLTRLWLKKLDSCFRRNDMIRANSGKFVANQKVEI